MTLTAPRLLRLSLVAACVLALGACQTARFGGGPAPRGGVVAGQTPLTQPLTPGIAAPTGVVEASELAPPPGATGMPGGALAGQGPIISDVPTSPQVAALPQQPAPAATPSRLTRTSFVGTWRVSEPGGTTCRVTLSSTPSLDLYRASTSGCQNEDMSRVSAWDLRNDEVFLYRQGGAVAARLRAGTGSMQGVLSRSGAPVALAR
ncbi:AprI/Inh family metalloprotease inhibitor [Salinarimonas sp.]|uniref:AprI/Inh family metalloprotease inhibitor n=1 Tax=Salinarimonas sp. TaxID=2766526 RepID=UPI00391A3AC0